MGAGKSRLPREPEALLPTKSNGSANSSNSLQFKPDIADGDSQSAEQPATISMSTSVLKIYDSGPANPPTCTNPPGRSTVREFLQPNSPTIHNPSIVKTKSGLLGKKKDKEQRAAVAAAFQKEIDAHASPQDNASRFLTTYITKHSNQITPMDRAKLDFVLEALKGSETVVVPHALADESSIPSMDIEDAQVQQWLRADFTPYHHKVRTGDARQRMKAVGLGVMAGRNLMRMVKGSQAQIPALPFECESSEEEQAILDCLQDLGEWDWDIFKLNEASKGRELQVLGWHVLNKWDLFQTFNLDQKTVKSWLRFVEDSYTDTEYHNCTHAADVLHGVYFMLTKAKVEKFLSEIEIFSLLIATMVHDLGHDGMNNNFHKNALTDRALAHNDQSIQENHHSSTVFIMMLANPEINILAPFDINQYVEIRRMIISIILATDMSKHFNQLKEFKQLIETKGQKAEDWTDSTDQILHAVMHICDISNPARPRKLAILWAERCLHEFFQQGAREKELGLPISPQCNPETTSMPASQIGFIKFIVLPTYQLLGTLLPEVEAICVKQLQANLEYWQEESLKVQKNDPSAVKVPTPAQARRASRSPERRGSLELVSLTTSPSIRRPSAEFLSSPILGRAGGTLIARSLQIRAGSGTFSDKGEGKPWSVIPDIHEDSNNGDT